MTFILKIIVGLTLMTSCIIARADNDCSVPMAEWQGRAAVQKMALSQGWAIHRIKVDDGCYEIRGLDSQGRSIEVKVDPGSLKIIEIEFEDEKVDEKDDESEDE